MKTKVFGLLILMEALFLFGVTAFAVYCHYLYGDNDYPAFAVATVLTASVGYALYFVGSRQPKKDLGRRDCYLIVAVAWVVFSVFGMLPYLAYGTVDTVTDAFFETMSGFTTTGATVLENIDVQPHGILLWRSLTQWMGGLGIVVFSFALIPVYELKNTNMFSAEVTGLSVDRLRPKIGATARRLLIIYFFATSVCALCYWLGDMNLYDAACHALATISTGGFSTHQSSIAFFDSAYIEYVCALFMIASGINFSLFYHASIGRWQVLWRNEEMRVYLAIVASFVILCVCLFYYDLYVWPTAGVNPDTLPHGFEQTFRSSLFHVAAIITSTGFAASCFDYAGWGTIFFLPTVVLMCCGACAGSTGGGIKVIRVIAAAKDAVNEFRLQLHPRAVLPVRLSGAILEESKVMRALAFIVLYVVLVVIAVSLLLLTGMDLHTSLGSAISALSNVGPGMGDTGPAFTYLHTTPAAKWILSILMLIGRLEIFTVMLLLMPEFWRHKA